MEVIFSLVLSSKIPWNYSNVELIHGRWGIQKHKEGVLGLVVSQRRKALIQPLPLLHIKRHARCKAGLSFLSSE